VSARAELRQWLRKMGARTPGAGPLVWRMIGGTYGLTHGRIRNHPTRLPGRAALRALRTVILPRTGSVRARADRPLDIDSSPSRAAAANSNKIRAARTRGGIWRCPACAQQSAWSLDSEDDTSTSLRASRTLRMKSASSKANQRLARP